jgi:uncharacterized integral membrane protein
MRSLRYLILGLVFIAVVAFSVANRHVVPFVLDPIAGPGSGASFEAPLFLYFFTALIAGFILGGFVMWMSQGRWRRTARQRAHEVAELRKENDRLARHLRIMERAPQLRTFASPADNQDRPVIH